MVTNVRLSEVLRPRMLYVPVSNKHGKRWWIERLYLKRSCQNVLLKFFVVDTVMRACINASLIRPVSDHIISRRLLGPSLRVAARPSEKEATTGGGDLSFELGTFVNVQESCDPVKPDVHRSSCFYIPNQLLFLPKFCHWKLLGEWGSCLSGIAICTSHLGDILVHNWIPQVPMGIFR